MPELFNYASSTLVLLSQVCGGQLYLEYRGGGGLQYLPYWLLRAVCLILLGVFIRESLVFMNTGEDWDLMGAVRPFLGEEAAEEVMDRGSGGGQPSGSSILPFLQEDHSRDRDAGSPGWGALPPIQELPPLEGGEDRDLSAAVKPFLPGAGGSSQLVGDGFNPLPGPSGSSDPTFFGAAGIDILDRDLLPSSPGDPRALPEIFDFIDSDEVEQPTAPELADELEPLISDEDRAYRIRKKGVHGF